MERPFPLGKLDIRNESGSGQKNQRMQRKVEGIKENSHSAQDQESYVEHYNSYVSRYEARLPHLTVKCYGIAGRSPSVM